LILARCYQKPEITACKCHLREYRDTMIAYDTTQIIYVGDEYFPNLDCQSYDNFFVVDVNDSAKWRAGDSTQLIKAYYTKCWHATF